MLSSLGTWLSDKLFFLKKKCLLAQAYVILGFTVTQYFHG